MAPLHGSSSLAPHPTGSGGDGRISALADDLSVARLARGARDNLIGAVLERGLGIALFLSLPFLLPPADLGAYYEILALVTIAVVLCVLGSDIAVVRSTILSLEQGRPGDVRRHLAAGTIVSGSLAAAVVAGVWLAAPALARALGDPDMVTAVRVAAVAIPFLVSASLMVAPARGLKLMGPTVLAIQVTQPAVALVVTVVLVRAGAGLEGAAWGFVLSAGLAALVALVLLGRLRLPPAGPGGPPVGSLLRFSLPIAGMTLTGTALLWIDTLLLGAFRPPGDVATYGVVVRLLAIAGAVLLTVIQVFGPFVTQLVARGDRDRLGAVLQTATRWVVLAAGPVLVLLVVVGGPLLRVFRQPSARGWAPLSILAGAFLVDALTGPVGHVLTMSGRSWLNLLNNAVSLVCNVALNLALIPRFGLIGAAVSWAVVIAGTNVARLVQVRRIFGITPFSRTLARPVAALAAGALGGVATRIVLAGVVASRPAVGIAAVAAVFGAVYLAMLGAMGLEEDDRTLVAVLLRRPAGV